MQFLQLHEPGETPQPHADEQNVAIGIDLGTTHSVVALATDEEHAEVMRDVEGKALIPSVVLYEDNAITVGAKAKERWAMGDERAIASAKRHMHSAAEPLLAGQKPVTPVEVSAEILKTMRAIAETDLGHAVTKAVITVPAYFDETARQATRAAAQLAGLDVLRLISEPTAAALAYGLDKGAEGIYAIYDLGGGTFDISLLKLEQGVFQVLATHGDTRLGGDDIDLLLAKHVSCAEKPASEIVAQARVAKERLSEVVEVELCGKRITRAFLDELIAPLIESTLSSCKQAIADAKLSVKDVKGVVMVGGSTRIPYVRAQAEAFFGTKPLTDVNPDEVVAVGAALQARGLTHGSDNLLLDVIPLSLGLETMGSLVEKIIYRNTPIPASVSQEFTTYQDGQTGMQIHVVQGEREMVEQNRSLARFELTGIPALPAGIARVKVSFTVDADGLLTVSAQESETGIRQQVEVKPTHGLPPEAIERMLLESMENAQGDIVGRLLVEARVEAERLIAEVESALRADKELLSTPELRLIGIQIGYLREAIQNTDRERIDAEVQQLHHSLAPFVERRMNKAIEKALKGTHIDAVNQ